MRTFKDNAGRTWAVSVDCDAIRRVRSVLQFNLANTEFGSVFDRITKDPVFTCEVVYVICAPEAAAQNVSEGDFLRALSGDAIQHLTKALLEEIVNFIPEHHLRRSYQKMLEKAFRMTGEFLEKAERRADETLARLDVPSPETSGPSSGVLPETSASIPGP